MHEPIGELLGLKPSDLGHLRRTYRRRMRDDEIVSADLARHLVEFSARTHRQVGALISRKGDVEYVIVGDAHRLVLPDIGRARAGQTRLRGLRLVHTHLREEPLTRDDLTDLALLRLDLVAAICLTPEGDVGALHFAHLLPGNRAGELWRVQTASTVSEQPHCAELLRSLETELTREAEDLRAAPGQERAVLLAVCLDGRMERAEASLRELVALARSAGVAVVEELIQKRPRPDPKYLIGRGKLEDLNLRAMQQGASLLIVDKDLTPGQARAIGEATSLKLLDRTQLILDIFAQRAHSGDGKLQVELAQLQYLLPRLARSDPSLSRLGAGIGGRGPGETKLELDRRRVRDRIAMLNRKIETLAHSRGVRRRRRERSSTPVVSLIGYTNAGKSSLLNALTGSHVGVENKLFATLDPTSRRLRLPSEREVIITDTVGFIRDLPEDLRRAFRATIEELAEADILLHVADAADEDRLEQLAAVEAILQELDLATLPKLLVWNKDDLITPLERAILVRKHPGVAVSASAGRGLDTLLAKIEALLNAGPTRGHAEAAAQATGGRARA